MKLSIGINAALPFLPFELTIILPPPRKARRIVNRDNLGRIIYAQPL